MNFSFGSKTTASSTPTTNTFNFGGGDNTNKIVFGAAATSASPGFSLGGAVTATAPSFGTPSFGFGPTGTTPTSQPIASGFNFAAKTPTVTTASGGDTTQVATTPAQSTPMGFSASSSGFTTPKTSAMTGFSLGTPLTSTTSTTSLSFATTPTPATTSLLSFGSAAPGGFSLGSVTPSTQTGLTLGKPLQSNVTSTSTSTVASSTNLLSTSSSILSLPTTSLSTTSVAAITTTTAVADAIVSSTGTLNFNELEEAINKWTVELEEQEKVFMNQALQLNAWDRLLITNGDKVLELNSIVERVKQEQQQLDHELDFIVAQQRELEESISPLEKELATLPVVDPDRQHTYQLAENMDSQLKQMSEDLKEIIEHLNETSRTEDVNDPIVQIGKILNAHMNSLEWIDRNTALISSHLDEVTKLHETHRREHEKTFHLTF